MTFEPAKLRALILDMDGVLWRGDQPIGDLPMIFSSLDKLGFQTTLATNNATLSVEQFLAKLNRFGVYLKPEQIITSPDAAVSYLEKRHPSGGPVFLVGEEGMVSTFLKRGFYHAHKDVIAVVAGLDRTFTYEKLAEASLLIQKGAIFIGTNPDRTLPMPQGFMPGAGAILAAIQAASDVEPIIMGKPKPEMYRLALERMKLEPSQVMVVGDRLETDIIGGQSIGCQTALLLSGVSKEIDARNWSPAVDVIAKDLTELIQWL